MHPACTSLHQSKRRSSVRFSPPRRMQSMHRLCGPKVKPENLRNELGSEFDSLTRTLMQLRGIEVEVVQS